jgi:predicted phage-related endonuclease
MSKSNPSKQAEGKLTPDDMLSGSQVPAVLGKNPYQTRNDLLKRAFDLLSGAEPEKLTHEAIGWGNKFEVDILNEACARLGLGNPKTTFNKPFIHDSIPLAVSLDGMIKGEGQVIKSDPSRNIFVMNADEIVMDGTGIIEAKLTGQDVDVELPDYRGKYQLQAQMMCTGAKYGFVCVLYRGVQMRIYAYVLDDEMVQEITEAAIDYRRRIIKYQENQETEWYPIESPKDAQNVYDEANDEWIDLHEMEDKVEAIVQMRQDIKDMEEQVKLYQTQIMSQMADRKYAQAGNYQVTWGEISFKPVPEKVIPAKPGRTVRNTNLRIKHNG